MRLVLFCFSGRTTEYGTGQRMFCLGDRKDGI